MGWKISCRDATRLALQEEDRALPLGQRLTLRWHQRLCRNCRRFARQLNLMRQANARWRQYSGE